MMMSGRALPRLHCSGIYQGERATLSEKEVNISKIAANARDLLQTLGRLVWAVNPKNDLLPAVALYFGGQARDFLRAAGIQCELQIPDELPSRPIESSIRHNLLLAMREALANVAKHAEASRVQIRLELSDLRLRMLIEDDGKGFETASISDRGNGLANMREWLLSIGGTFVCESVPGRGTKIVFEVPLTQDSSTHGVPYL
jgi:signal transduction histidine kinase